jgi:hypothetical protein
VREKHSAAWRTYFREFIDASEDGGGYFGTLAGRVFEDYAVEELRAGGTFDVKRLPTDSLAAAKEKIRIPPNVQKQDIEQERDLLVLADSFMGVPIDSNFPVLDAAQQSATFSNMYQMKKGAKKPLKVAHLTRLMTYFSHRPIRLYQVVPDFQYAKASNLTYDDNTQAPADTDLEHWILPINLRGLTKNGAQRGRKRAAADELAPDPERGEHPATAVGQQMQTRRQGREKPQPWQPQEGEDYWALLDVDEYPEQQYDANADKDVFLKACTGRYETEAEAQEHRHLYSNTKIVFIPSQSQVQASTARRRAQPGTAKREREPGEVEQKPEGRKTKRKRVK